MKKNVGLIDKMVRVLIAILIAGLFFTNIISGTIGIVLLIFALILVATSFVSFCPLYLPFKITTKKESS